MNDFDKITECLRSIKETVRSESYKNPSGNTLKDLKNAINNAFPDSECLEVLFTRNDDKIFFGMCVYPSITDGAARHIATTSELFRVEQYYIEMDSKLFDAALGLTDRELTAILLHEVGHMTNTSAPADELRKALDMNMAKCDYSFDNNENSYFILKYGFADALIKITSIFYQKDEEFKADAFAIKYGYGPDLESAMNKIYKNNLLINKNINDKFILLSWTLRLYKNVKLRRIPALRVINKSLALTPCEGEKRIFRSLKSELINAKLTESNKDDKVESAIHEGRLGQAMFKMKMNGISGFENDLYEYRMLITNIEEQDEAILVMRQINNRISILEDMIENKDISRHQLEKVSNLLDGFKELRETLSKKVTYKDRFIGVTVNYPAIKGVDY